MKKNEFLNNLTEDQKNAFLDELEDFLGEHANTLLYDWMNSNVECDDEEYDVIFDKKCEEAHQAIFALVREHLKFVSK